MAVIAAGTVDRVDLGAGSWVDLAKGWLPDAGGLFDRLAREMPWRPMQVFRYERWIDRPRLGANVRDAPPDVRTLLDEVRVRLIRRYRVDLTGGSMLLYRDGRDSLGFHRDGDMRYLDDTVIAVLTIGGPRPFALRPAQSHNDTDWSAVRTVAPGPGDLLVMGGRCGADWQHGVPKQHRLGVPGRISVQWRWTSGKGRPVIGPPSRAPRTYSS